MTLYLKGKLQCERSVFGAVAAAKCDRIVLNAKDFRDLATLSPEQLKEWLLYVQCRFVPGAADAVVTFQCPNDECGATQ